MADPVSGAAAGHVPETITKQDDSTPRVVWDDSNMRSSFANVVNGASTREEVTLFFGTNKTWNLNDTKEVKVALSDRIILTPYAAKRLWVLLGGILKQYEDRFGVLQIDTRGGGDRQAKN